MKYLKVVEEHHQSNFKKFIKITPPPLLKPKSITNKKQENEF
jgi:hypothetical protein